MIISDLNVLETVEAGNVLGGYGSRAKNRKNDKKGKRAGDVIVDRGGQLLQGFADVVQSNEAEQTAFIFSGAFSINEIFQVIEQENFSEIEFEND